jgi:hypothetical protein
MMRRSELDSDERMETFNLVTLTRRRCEPSLAHAPCLD